MDKYYLCNASINLSPEYLTPRFTYYTHIQPFVCGYSTRSIRYLNVLRSTNNFIRLSRGKQDDFSITRYIYHIYSVSNNRRSRYFHFKLCPPVPILAVN